MSEKPLRYSCPLCGETFGSHSAWMAHHCAEAAPAADHPEQYQHGGGGPMTFAEIAAAEYHERQAEAFTPSALARQEGGGHYKDMAIQPIEFIHKNGIPFIEGSVIKYVARWRKKNGVEDLKKARHFIDLLIELESAKCR